MKLKRKRLLIALFLSFIFVYMHAGIQPLYAQEKPYQLNNQAYYQVETIYNIKNAGNSKVWDLNLDISAGNEFLTRNMPYAALLYSSSWPEPGNISSDGKGNQKTSYIIESIQPGGSIEIKTVQIFRVAEIAYRISQQGVGDY